MVFVQCLQLYNLNVHNMVILHLIVYLIKTWLSIYIRKIVKTNQSRSTSVKARFWILPGIDLEKVFFHILVDLMISLVWDIKNSEQDQENEWH